MNNYLCYRADCQDNLMVTHTKYGGKGKINSGLDIRGGFINLYYLSRLMSCIKFVFFSIYSVTI